MIYLFFLNVKMFTFIAQRWIDNETNCGCLFANSLINYIEREAKPNFVFEVVLFSSSELHSVWFQL